MTVESRDESRRPHGNNAPGNEGARWGPFECGPWEPRLWERAAGAAPVGAGPMAAGPMAAAPREPRPGSDGQRDCTSGKEPPAENAVAPEWAPG